MPPLTQLCLSRFFRNCRLPFMLLVAILLPVTRATEADACGGFFCSASTPVNQAAERIVFSKNDDGTITSIIQIMYEGPSEKFAWVLPVPGNPEVGVSSELAFDRLQAATNPQYRMSNPPSPFACAASVGTGGSTATGGSNSGATPPTVQVVQSGSVGPFDFDVISVRAEDDDPALVAVEWLGENDYDVTGVGEDTLRPYLQNGLNLIAFRLTKGATAGSIRPVTLTYEADRAAIPIRPTAVAANDDMGVMVWVLGDHRAVPTNYKGLILNELLINWFNPGSTYDDVVTAAANEAGGQGFVTEFAGTTEGYSQPLDVYTDNDEALFDQVDAQVDVWPLTRQASAAFAQYDGFVDVVREHVVLRDGVTVENFLACVDCYFNGFDSVTQVAEAGNPVLLRYGQEPPVGGLGGAGPVYVQETISEDDPIYTTDIDAFKQALQDDVLQPLSDFDDLLQGAEAITRLYTTMSADEMTLDPEFDFNPDLDLVSNVHILESDTPGVCSSEWTATFPDGSTVSGTNTTWPFSLADVGENFFVNSVIEEYSTSGPPTVVTDHRPMIEITATETGVYEPGPADPDSSPNASEDDRSPGGVSEASSGCSYSQAGGGGRGALAALLALSLCAAGLRRRRPATCGRRA